VLRKNPGIHALRHFFASWCINRKKDGGLELPLKTVQQRRTAAYRRGHCRRRSLKISPAPRRAPLARSPGAGNAAGHADRYLDGRHLH
jgi:hypothetical protein